MLSACFYLRIRAAPTEERTPQGDGQIEINVTHGDAPFEFSLDGETWQDESVFDNLVANEYFVMARSKAGVAIGAPRRYRTVTVGTTETRPAE